MTKVLIIGAGVAGLSAGSHLQLNGYETEIFELHNTAGGLCTSWKRGEYVIDGCIHWWENTNPKDPIYPVLDGLVDMQNFPQVTYEEFCSVEEDGKVLRFFGDLDKLETELKTIAPQDSKIIEEVISGAKRIASMRIPADKTREVMNLWDKLRMALKMLSMKRMFNKWKMPMGEYSKKFNSSLIRKLLSVFPFDPDSPMFLFLRRAAVFHNKNACYPQGGAQELTNRLVHRYKSLGGKISYSSRVDKICVDEGCAKGIQLESGKTYTADYIISAADGHHTICDLLEGRYVDEHIKELYYSGKYVPTMSSVYVSLGVARTFEDSFKPYVFIALKNHLKIGDEEISDVGITIHNFDLTAAPAGKTVLTMMILVHDSEYWVKLRNENRAEYNKQKERIAQHMIEELDAHFGHVKQNVEMIDVATPATYIRYTNNWNGAPGAWQDISLSINKPEKEIQGLKNFFLCGQWLGDAGLSGAAQSGRDITQILCKRDGRKFKALT